MAQYFTKKEAEDAPGEPFINYGDEDISLYRKAVNILRTTPYTTLPDSLHGSQLRFLVHFEFLVFYKDNRASRWVKDVIDTPDPFSAPFRQFLSNYVDNVRGELHNVEYKPEEL